jgi:hypothetical protein
MEMMNGPSDEVTKRIELGADASLLALFGYDNPSENTQSVTELRKYVLEGGFYTRGQVETENVISVADHGDEIYPAFQFDILSKQPIPILQEINKVLLTDDMRPWEAAMWWTTSNGYLDGRTPVEVIGTDFEQYLFEAVQEEVNSVF